MLTNAVRYLDPVGSLAAQVLDAARHLVLPTLHANSASAALLRLLSLVEEAGVPAQAQLIAEAVNLLAFMERTSITGRRLTELVHVEGYSQNGGFKFASAI